jgi:hypothetical protein
VRDTVRFSVFDDRGLYRPGEEVRVKGWARLVTGGKGGDVLPLGDPARTLSYTLRDSQGNEITKGTRALSAFGSFDLALKLPPTMNLGDAALQLVLDAQVPASHQHTIKVQEFRRPEFEVSPPERGAALRGDHATVACRQLLRGGGLPAPDHWRVSARAGHFVPPNRDSFGTWTPWWWSPPSDPEKVPTFTAHSLTPRSASTPTACALRPEPHRRGTSPTRNAAAAANRWCTLLALRRPERRSSSKGRVLDVKAIAPTWTAAGAGRSS